MDIEKLFEKIMDRYEYEDGKCTIGVFTHKKRYFGYDPVT
jgi:hypothetical protein